MGSYLLQAGETRRIAGNAMVMIHDPWTIAYGNSGELRKEAEVLDKYRDRMVPDYARASGKSSTEIEEIMAAETWYTAAEAVEAGFADEIEAYDDEQDEPEPQVASLHRIARNMPAEVAAMVAVARAQRQDRRQDRRGENPQRETPRRERAKAIAASIKCMQ